MSPPRHPRLSTATPVAEAREAVEAPAVKITEDANEEEEWEKLKKGWV